MGWWLMIDKTRVVTMVDHFLHGWAPRTTGHFTCVGAPLGLRVGSTWKCCTGIRVWLVRLEVAFRTPILTGGGGARTSHHNGHQLRFTFTAFTLGPWSSLSYVL